ncbi:hypothetical protein [Phenylobacterium sp.]|jgi:precorrin-6B methylase 2|uniref:hypothetical protein n=1 Tax=Phenylobacterium sp. TaxID=1871053 RepID=UPI002E30EA61|nr:hypothetical protein [Phenylobacterium sp.]HEX2562245.1 hypothetical protein [Phenylobacterium sp.]
MSIHEQAARWLRRYVAEIPDLEQPKHLDDILRKLAIWRSRLIANTIIAHHGVTVLEGPFAGMEYVSRATEGALAPRLFGSYESELHPYLEALRDTGLECVIDVGCAEGYYAVGLARMFPDVSVHAHDTDAAAREACAELAARNGVSDRVVIGGEFSPEDFQAFAGRNALVFVDAEGAEDDVLIPERAPALAGMRIIVETHDIFRRGVKQRLIERFTPTHDIVEVRQGAKTTPLPEWVGQLGHLDQLLAYWEWRRGPTPWLVMSPRR